MSHRWCLVSERVLCPSHSPHPHPAKPHVLLGFCDSTAASGSQASPRCGDPGRFWKEGAGHAGRLLTALPQGSRASPKGWACRTWGALARDHAVPTQPVAAWDGGPFFPLSTCTPSLPPSSALPTLHPHLSLQPGISLWSSPTIYSHRRCRLPCPSQSFGLPFPGSTSQRQGGPSVCPRPSRSPGSSPRCLTLPWGAPLVFIQSC